VTLPNFGIQALNV